jgi:hypothetical protein
MNVFRTLSPVVLTINALGQWKQEIKKAEPTRALPFLWRFMFSG